jgi:hypothetical protein
MVTKTKDAPDPTGTSIPEAATSSQPQNNYSILAAALQYAERGFYVLPVNGKVAFTTHGKDDATTDPVQIKAWWKKNPKANVAINLEKSSLFALDVDNNESWGKMLADHGGKANLGPVQSTPSGGKHLIFLWPEGLTIPAKVNAFETMGYPGLDLRSKSYIVLAPSQIEGKAYTWLPDHGPDSQIYPPPAWLVDLIRDLNHPAAGQINNPPDWNHFTPTDKTAWAQNLLDRLALSRCNNYSDWINVGMALSDLGEAGLVLWDSWSRKSPDKYKGFDDCSNRWKNIKPREGITLGSLYYWANQDSPTPSRVIVSREQEMSPFEFPEEGESEENTSRLPFVSYIPELPKIARLTPKEEEKALQAGRWIDEYVKFAEQASPMTPSLFHQSFALGILSTAIARRVYTNTSRGKIYPNLYMLLIAPSTLYAKTTGLEVATDLLSMAGLDHFTLPTGVTPQSLITELSHRIPPTFNDWDKDGKDDWQKERSLAAQRSWWMDEAASILDLFKQKNTADLLALILKLFNCPNKISAITIGRGRETVRFAYLTICGPTTPAAMRSHLKTPEFWGDGLFARFLFATPNSPPVCVFFPENVVIPPELAKHINTLAFQRLATPKDSSLGNIEPPPTLEAAYLPEVYKKWKTYWEALFSLSAKKVVPEKLHACYGRFATTALKIAQLLAVSDWAQSAEGNPLIIRQEHWNRAQIMTEEYRASLHRLVEDASQPIADEDQEIREKVIAHANTSRNSKREIRQDLHMQAGIQRDRLDKIISQILSDGLLELKTIKKTSGPGTERLYIKNP